MNTHAVLSDCEKFNMTQARQEPLVKMLNHTPSHMFSSRIRELESAIEHLTTAWNSTATSQVSHDDGGEMSSARADGTTLNYEAIASDCEMEEITQGSSGMSDSHSNKRRKTQCTGPGATAIYCRRE